MTTRPHRRELLAKFAPAIAVGAAAPLALSPLSALAGTGALGALTLIDPTRIQDSRTMEEGKYFWGSRDGLFHEVLSGARAALLNVTVTDTEGAGWLRLGPEFQDPPRTSNINWWADGQTLANLAIVQLTELGGFKVQGGGTGAAHLIIDVLGVFS